jgi:curved DNA-binding protein CbpA
VKTDYYSVLELWPTSSAEEVKANYFRLAKLYHPDVAGDTPENRDRFKLINEAYAVLSNSQKRHEYDESLRRGKGKSGSRDAVAIQEKDRRSASLAFSQAQEAIREGRYDKAALLLKSAVKYDPTNPAYHSWYGFSLAMTNSQLHEARDACKKSIQMEFYNPDYHANLGLVYFRAGLKSLAVKHFNEAIKWDPDNRVARTFMAKMGDAQKREEGPIDKFVSAMKGLFSKV